MMQWYDYILIVISILLIMFIVLQNSKGNAMSAFSGEKTNTSKARGAEKVVNNIITVLSIGFFVVALLSMVLR